MGVISDGPIWQNERRLVERVLHHWTKAAAGRRFPRHSVASNQVGVNHVFASKH
jgi:hypothetical protein